MSEETPVHTNPCGEIVLTETAVSILHLPHAINYQIAKLACEVWLQLVLERYGGQRTEANKNGKGTFNGRLAAAIKEFIRTHESTNHPKHNWPKLVNWEQAVLDFWSEQSRCLSDGFMAELWPEIWKATK